jgi:hypothetical protein
MLWLKFVVEKGYEPDVHRVRVNHRLTIRIKYGFAPWGCLGVADVPAEMTNHSSPLCETLPIFFRTLPSRSL